MPLKLTKRPGRPFWYIRGTVRGRSVYRSTGIGLKDRSLAEAHRIQVEAELLQSSVFGERAVQDFSGAAIHYMNATGENRFLAPIIKKLGRLKLSEVSQQVVDKTARELYPTAAPSTVNRQVYTPISAVLKYAGEHTKLRRPKERATRTDHFTPDEVDRLIEAARPHMRPMITFLIGTGARCGEALKLEWGHVRLDERKVMFWETKSNHPRGVPLSPRVVAALASMPHREGRVFRTHRHKPYPVHDHAGGQFKTAWKGTLERAKLRYLKPHACRHTWATWFYSYTRDMVQTMQYGGWHDTKQVMRYVHLSSPALGQAAERSGWAISVPYWEQNPDKYLMQKEEQERA